VNTAPSQTHCLAVASYNNRIHGPIYVTASINPNTQRNVA